MRLDSGCGEEVQLLGTFLVLGRNQDILAGDLFKEVVCSHFRFGVAVG